MLGRRGICAWSTPERGREGERDRERGREGGERQRETWLAKSLEFIAREETRTKVEMQRLPD